MEKSTIFKFGKPSISIRAMAISHGKLLVITRPGISLSKLSSMCRTYVFPKKNMIYKCWRSPSLAISTFINCRIPSGKLT